MNKKIGLAIVGVIILALIIWFATRNKDTDDTSVKNDTTQASEKDTATSEQSSFKNLLSSGSSKTCTYSYDVQGSKSEGTVYTASGKMRGDISTVVNGNATSMHMISDGTTMYNWIDGQTTGFKMSMQANTTAQNQNQNQALDPDKNYNFSCKNWSADSSKFDLPTSVTFTDLSALTNPSTPAAGSAMQASICAALSGDAKAQCEAALKKQ